MHFDERQALYLRMKFIHDELQQINNYRMELKNELCEIRNRLQELDKRGNTTAELTMIDILNKLTDLLGSYQKPEMQIQSDAITAIKQIAAISGIPEVHKEEPKISTNKIMNQKEDDDKRSPIKKRKNLDMSIEASRIAGILKANKEPMKLSVIAEEIEKKFHTKYNNPTLVLTYAMKNNKKIVKVGFGLYQYQFSE